MRVFCIGARTPSFYPCWISLLLSGVEMGGSAQFPCWGSKESLHDGAAGEGEACDMSVSELSCLVDLDDAEGNGV